MIVALWLALAGAQEAPAPPDPAPDEAPAEEPDDGFTEVIVYSEHLAKAARDKLMRQAEAMGYTEQVRKDDRTILRHEAKYNGEIVLYDDGRVEFKRQPVQFEPPFDKSKPLSWLSCVIVPLCIRAGGQAYAPRKFRAQERRAMAEIADAAGEWNERIADVALDRKLGDLPDRLQALWDEGTPLEAGLPTLATFSERKTALLRYWDSRTDTEWGEEVRDAVASFLRAVVQRSDTPITAAELEAFNRRRQAPRPLVLERPSDGP